MDCYRIAVVVEATPANLVLMGKCFPAIKSMLETVEGKAVIKACREEILLMVGTQEIASTRGAPEGRRAS